MARKTRRQLLYDGCFAHIHSRALGRKPILRTEKDFEVFKCLLRENKSRFSYCLYHYCLMHTHFHLLVSLESVACLSQGMKELKRLYANYLHKEQRGDGPVWWGRYGSQLIEDELYLAASGLYIERNPVKAGMVMRPEEWHHSSSRHYFLGEKDSLIDSYIIPSIEETTKLLNTLNFEKESILGSELFRIHVEEGILTA